MLASHNSIQKKDDIKRATKPLIKKKGKEKGERERNMIRFAKKFGFYARVKNKNAV